MVGLAQGGHHLPLNEVLAAEAASPIESLVVQSTDVFTLPHEEASLGQFTATHWLIGKVKGYGTEREKRERGWKESNKMRKGWRERTKGERKEDRDELDNIDDTVKY